MKIFKHLKRFLQSEELENNTKWLGERESPRYNITFFACCQAGGQFAERRGNIGIGGFCIEGEYEYPPGTQVELSFRLPGKEAWIHVHGTVLGHTYAHSWLGIRGRFTDMDFEDERLLAHWLDDMTLELRVCAA